VIEAAAFLGAARERGFRLYSGVPCSYLKPFIDYVIDSDELRYVGAANEGDAVAIGAGAELGGMRSVVMFQNSGLGNAVNPLTSLTWTFRLPVLLVPTLRGEPGGPPDEPQHELMGQITSRLLELMEIPWEWFPAGEQDVGPALDRAVAHMQTERRPYALVMRKGTVAAHPVRSQPTPRPLPPATPRLPVAEPVGTRTEALRRVQACAGPDDVVLATTGYTGRELYALDDRPGQLYMVGSMGCVASLALGLALARPHRRVIALDGDGALLMRLGVLATIGHERPPDLIHVLLDNQRHESTGGQSTVSHSVDFPSLAAACGYAAAARVGSLDELSRALTSAEPGPRFLHVPIAPGVPADLPRPSVRPHEVAARLRAHLEAQP
jgi:phosphonopyruvate decarboxylase